jgi:hypothetical protein
VCGCEVGWYCGLAGFEEAMQGSGFVGSLDRFLEMQGKVRFLVRISNESK